jgi:hypothetical protein
MKIPWFSFPEVSSTISPTPSSKSQIPPIAASSISAKPVVVNVTENS